MATSIHHSLLQSPNSLISKPLCVILSLITILIGSLSLLSLTIYTSTNHPLLQPTQICTQTHDPKTCVKLVSQTLTTISSTNKITGIDLLHVFLNNSIPHIKKTIKKAKNVRFESTNYYNRGEEAALSLCIELLDSSIDQTIDSMSALKVKPIDSGVHSWLSAVLTNHVTCLDELNELTELNGVNGNSSMEILMNELISIGRTSLAIYVSMNSGRGEITMRPLMKVVEFPEWMSRKDRRLMGYFGNKIKADVVVAKDGSGKFKSLKEAIDGAPNNSKKRYVIYIKKGIYKENVEIIKSKTNIMLLGDGMESTIITGNITAREHSITTFKTATVAVAAPDFMAQGIWFQNTAGPTKNQSVALLVRGDRSVIHKCKIEAYQDTLYTHCNRQFYKSCHVIGTVDFICGNAAVVFQNCIIETRKPRAKQSDTVTAQKRCDPNANTGISIQSSKIVASSDLVPVKGSVRTYLGRPWKEHARTVVMQSWIGDHVDPSGWLAWDDKESTLETLYYGEYENCGPGANTSKRVKWKGYHVITSKNEAQKFTVAELIKGGDWLKPSGVPFNEGL